MCADTSHEGAEKAGGPAHPIDLRWTTFISPKPPWQWQNHPQYPHPHLPSHHAAFTMSDWERYLSRKTFCGCTHQTDGTFFFFNFRLVLPAETNKNELRSLSWKAENKYACFRTRKHPSVRDVRKREEEDVKWHPKGPVWLANVFCLEQGVWLDFFFNV